MTFSDDADDLENGNWTLTPSKKAVRVDAKRRAFGSAVESGSERHPKIVAFEIGDGSDEESVAMRSGVGRVNAGMSCLSSNCPDKILTELEFPNWK